MADPIDLSLGTLETNLKFPDTDAERFDKDTFQELVADRSEAYTFSTTGSEGALKFHGPWPQMYAAVQFLIGLDYVEKSGDTYTLRRIPPAAHPWLDYMRCSGLSVTGVRTDGDPETRKVKTRPARAVLNPTREKTAVYTRAEYTVKFTHNTFPIGSDAIGATGEQNRYFRLRTEPCSPELFSADNLRQLKFPEPPFANNPAIPAAFAGIKNSANLVGTWWRVPSSWLFSKGTYPKRLIENLGSLNTEEFFGHAKETLRFDSYGLEEFHYPISTVNPDLIAVGYNVALNFNLFDPKNAVENSPYRGHNLQPVKQGGVVQWAYAVDAQDNLTPLYSQKVDYAELFKCAKVT